MKRNKAYARKNLLFVFSVLGLVFLLLCVRLAVLMISRSEHFGKQAKDVQQRERRIKSERGNIYDVNGTLLTGNRPVCTISVIHSQLKDPEQVIRTLTDILGMEEKTIRKKVEKNSIREKIRSNVDKEIADRIRKEGLSGVVIDEDYKRFYPYGNLASHVLGFTGADNQGILGLEVQYDEVLKGTDGRIYTYTTANGLEIAGKAEERKEPLKGKDLITSIDINIQMYAQQLAEKLFVQKGAKGVRIIVMNPQDGSIYAMVDVPEFDLNNPYDVDSVKKLGIFQGKEESDFSGPEKAEGNQQEKLNQIWRNFCISDTYEPGSTFKVITAASALEEGVVSEKDTFFCPGYRKVKDRMIRCHKAGGHGSETFVQGIQNSCNPVFMDVGARLGIDKFYQYFKRFGLFDKTGIDLPGEASSIMHKAEEVGEVELATISFGQSFQITPMQMICAASRIINGGKKIVPHFGLAVSGDVCTEQGKIWKRVEKINEVKTKERVLSEETSKTMQKLLESVVSEGTGKNAFISGFAIGGKTATSEKLPRRSGKYIASFIGFAPANDPKVITLLMIDEPKGAYYGGTIAAPAVRELYENILPYLLHK